MITTCASSRLWPTRPSYRPMCDVDVVAFTGGDSDSVQRVHVCVASSGDGCNAVYLFVHASHAVVFIPDACHYRQMVL